MAARKMKPQIENRRVEEKIEKTQPDILVEKAVRGDKDALYSLCEKIAKGVLFRTTYIMGVGAQADAEDVSQEVLIRVCEKIQTLRDPQAFNVWLNRIISNEVNRCFAKKGRHGVVLNIDDYLESIMEEKDDFIPQEFVENEECRKEVMDIIVRLPLRQREAVILHYYDGLSVTEIAAAMDISKPRVSECLAIARQKMKRELEKTQLGRTKPSTAAFMPMGSFFTGVLHREANSFLSGGDWLQGVLSQCQEYIKASSAASIALTNASKPLAIKLLSWFLAGCLTVAVTSGLIALNRLPVNVSTDRTNVSIPAEASVIGEVIFSGGVDHGEENAYQNPTGVQPVVTGKNGELTVTGWQIIALGSGEELYSGRYGSEDSALLELKESGKDGVYMIYYFLEDVEGFVYRLGSNFFIETTHSNSR